VSYFLKVTNADKSLFSAPQKYKYLLILSADMVDDLRIQCGSCKGFAPASQFKLHYKFKKVVCPSCFSGRTETEEKKKAAAAAQAPEQPKKPAGWDKEDEYLERMARIKEKDLSSKIEKIPGTTLVKFNCQKCNYPFKYDPYRKMPKACPYCNIDIPNLKSYTL
jgi:Zn finger protein HypA/HybF involved in hydrogenase expression